MENRRKLYLKLNLMSLFFVAVSFLSITLAWFAYSGIGKVATEVEVKSWSILFKNKGQIVDNNIVIQANDIYPGMNPIIETIDIENNGDSDAQISYKINKARVLDEVLNNSNPMELEDKLSHEYPFHIDISLKKNYAVAKNGKSKLVVAVSWPLDSDNNKLDSIWGNKAYNFQVSEVNKKNNDKKYEIRPSLDININLKAEQFVVNNNAPDRKYYTGNMILYDVVNNTKCDSVSTSCLKMYVVDTNNKIGDTEVNFIPDLNNDYLLSNSTNYNTKYNELVKNWQVINRPLKLQDLLNIVSKDIVNSVLVRNNLSDMVIGDLKYNGRFDKELNKVLSYKGYYKYKNTSFEYLVPNKCYYINTNYDDGLFSLKNTGEFTEINKELNECSIIPIVTISKSNLLK